MTKLSKFAKRMTKSFQGANKLVYPVVLDPTLQAPSYSAQFVRDYVTRHKSLRNHNNKWGIVSDSHSCGAAYAIAHALDFFALLPNDVDKILCLGPDAGVTEYFDATELSRSGVALLYDDANRIPDMTPVISNDLFSYSKNELEDVTNHSRFSIQHNIPPLAVFSGRQYEMLSLENINVGIENPTVMYNGPLSDKAKKRILRAIVESKWLPQFSYSLAYALEKENVMLRSDDEAIARLVEVLGMGLVEVNRSAFECEAEVGYKNELLPCRLNASIASEISEIFTARAELCYNLDSLMAIWQASLEEIGLRFDANAFLGKWAFDSEVAEHMAEYSGAKARIEAWLNGVPVQDIIGER